MKLFFEDYDYHLPIIQKSGISKYFYITEKYDEAKLISVGYFYAPEIQDAVFVLPKIFLGRISHLTNIDGNYIDEPGPDNTSRWAVFGKYLPESIYDLSDPNNPLLKDHRLQTILQMTIWLYQSIKVFAHRNGKTEIISTQPNLVAKGVGRSANATFIDIILSLLRFHKEHQSLFTYISIINSSGNNRIHWGKTISHVQPVLQNRTPVYGEYCNKNKIINYDEEIIVLFYSVLDYLRESYHFSTKPNINYNLIPTRKIRNYIETGKGTKLLRTIRRKYFTDELVALWNLLYAFFEKAEHISTGRQDEEALMVRNYNIIFEDMVDALIGNSDYDKLRKLPDGKIIDHLYTDKSFTSDCQIYFIGDSKYYKSEETIDGTSVFKQYTYAKNIIQININLALENNLKSNFRYRDNLSEGYDITPNFFIRGYVDSENMDFSDPALKPMRNQFTSNRHFYNRPFDRDSLVLCGFNINFLYVLSHYVFESVNSQARDALKGLIRKGIANCLNETYDFYKVFPEMPINDFIEEHRDKFRGQLFWPSDDSLYVLFGTEKSIGVSAEELLSTNAIRRIEKIALV